MKKKNKEEKNKEKSKTTKTDEPSLKPSIQKKFGLRESARVLME